MRLISAFLQALHHRIPIAHAHDVPRAGNLDRNLACAINLIPAILFMAGAVGALNRLWFMECISACSLPCWKVDLKCQRLLRFQSECNPLAAQVVMFCFAAFQALAAAFSALLARALPAWQEITLALPVAGHVDVLSAAACLPALGVVLAWVFGRHAW